MSTPAPSPSVWSKIWDSVRSSLWATPDPTGLDDRERELKEKQLRLDVSINSLNVGFIMTDTKGNVLMTNSAGKRLLAAQIDQTLNPEALAWIHEPMTLNYLQYHLKDTADILKLIQESIAGAKPITIPPFPHENRFLTVHITPIINRNQQSLEFTIMGTVILIEDVTEAKRLERTRDEFFSIASHELRTPLTAIRGNASMIREYLAPEIKDPRLLIMINDIHDASVRLIRIVNDFLQVSRLEQGKMEYLTQTFDLAPLIDGLLQELQPLAKEKDIALRWDRRDSNLPQVVADPDRTKEVLINLIGNAIKYTKTGAVTVTLQQENEYLKTLVSDTGQGIAPEYQSLIFHKFQQASEHILTRDSSRSTGLGLYISKLLIEGMGGTIQMVRSDVNQGSTFSFTLPTARGLTVNTATP